MVTYMYDFSLPVRFLRERLSRKEKRQMHDANEEKEQILSGEEKKKKNNGKGREDEEDKFEMVDRSGVKEPPQGQASILTPAVLISSVWKSDYRRDGRIVRAATMPATAETVTATIPIPMRPSRSILRLICFCRSLAAWSSE